MTLPPASQMFLSRNYGNRSPDRDRLLRSDRGVLTYVSWVSAAYFRTDLDQPNMVARRAPRFRKISRPRLSPSLFRNPCSALGGRPSNSRKRSRCLLRFNGSSGSPLRCTRSRSPISSQIARECCGSRKTVLGEWVLPCLGMAAAAG